MITDTAPSMTAADLMQAMRGITAPPPLLLSPLAAREFLGLSKSGFYRLTHQDQLFPKPIDVPGSGPRWRRADLEKWAGQLRGRRRTPTLVGAN